MNDKLKTAELVGLLLTDGGVTCVNGNWKVHFTNTSDALNQKFQELVQELLHCHVSRENKSGAVIQRASVNKFIDKLFKLSPSFRTSPCSSFPVCSKLRGKDSKPCKVCRPCVTEEGEKFPPASIPKFLFHNKQAALSFLRCAFSCDGSVILSVGRTKKGFRLQREVRLFCKHPCLLNQFKVLLKKLGFHPKISVNTIIIRGRQELTKFFREIGFVRGAKITRNEIWGGFEKFKLLELCVKSFEMPEVFRFKSKEEIIQFFRNLLLGLEAGRSNPD